MFSIYVVEFKVARGRRKVRARSLEDYEDVDVFFVIHCVVLSILLDIYVYHVSCFCTIMCI